MQIILNALMKLSSLHKLSESCRQVRDSRGVTKESHFGAEIPKHERSKYLRIVPLSWQRACQSPVSDRIIR